MKGGRRVALLLALLVPALRAAAEDPSPPIPQGRPPEWSLAAGYGFSIITREERAHEHFFVFEPGVSFRLGSRFEWVVEGHVARYFTPEGYMVGVVPLGGRYYAGHGRVLPYFFLGAGAGWTDLTELYEISRRFNFLLQGSFGVRGALEGGQAWTFELRYAHISNAGTQLPNHGLNNLGVLAGWRF